MKEKTAAKKTNTREGFVRKRGNALKQETQNELERFRDYLREQEKSSHTIEKYCRDVRKFLMFAGEEWDKNTIISFKEYLQAHYKTSSANSMLASLNSYFHFIGRQEYCVRTFRVQKRIFCDERREMTRSDYQKLVKAARGRGDERLCAILQTIASTGIRISELSYITAESLAQGEVVIDCKGKQRVILLPAVADAVSDAVLPEAADCERQYLCHKKRAGSPQTECVGGHEIRLRRSRCSSEQGISAQSAPSVCQDILRARSRSGPSGRLSGSQQRGNDKTLYDHQQP